MTRATFQRRIVAMIEDRGCATTVDDLMPQLPEFTRKQVTRSMQNAHYRGFLLYERGSPRAGFGARDGSRPGYYSPRPGAARQEPAVAKVTNRQRLGRVSSVWEYAQRSAT